MSDMFNGALLFNQDISGWNTDSLQQVYQFCNVCPLNQDLSGWNVSSLTDARDMFMNGAGLSTANYDALLNGWASQPVQTGVVFGAGNSQYSNAGLSARNTTLIGTNNWTITDLGCNGTCTPICTPNWTCDTFGSCNESNILPCNSMADTNFCGTNFTGNLSDYNDVCTYVPPVIQYREGSDLTGAVVDNGTKIIVGFGSIALLLGLLVGGAVVVLAFNKLIIKK